MELGLKLSLAYLGFLVAFGIEEFGDTAVPAWILPAFLVLGTPGALAHVFRR